MAEVADTAAPVTDSGPVALATGVSGREAAGGRFKVLLVHNFYRLPGGEDQCFAADRDMLESRGHEVSSYTLRNDAISSLGYVSSAARTIWNRAAHREVGAMVRSRRPDIVHFTNTFPLVSPAAYYAARAEGAAVVQTLHNFRLGCPSAILFRDGAPCEDCLGQAFAWQGVAHGCYRGSRLGTAVVAAMLAIHRLAGTWNRQVDAYIALTGFARGKYVQAGLDPELLHVSPNYLPSDLRPGSGRGRYVLFAGRLTPEKGVNWLLDAWSRMGPDARLVVVGDGPLKERMREAADRDRRIEWLGWKPHGEVLGLIREAACLVLPSLWYEGFNRVILEAFAQGTPVVASNLGSMGAIVEQCRTGLLVRPGDAEDLAVKLGTILADPVALNAMRTAAREEFERRYTEEVCYGRLMRIYDTARRRYEARIAS